MNCIGISASAHDPAIAVVNSAGEVVFAEATERHLQNKRGWSCIPDGQPFIDAIVERYCDPRSPLVIAKTWSRAHCVKVQLATLLHTFVSPLFTNAGSLSSLVDRYRYMLRLQESSLVLSGETLRYGYQHADSPYFRYLHKYKRSWARDSDSQADSRGLAASKERVTIRHFDHHLTHAAAACYGSPFDEAVCAVIDGFGEGTSTAYYGYQEGLINPLKARQKSTNSLGFFYAGVCMACGFNPDRGEEWKVMGLAPYGRLRTDVYEKLSNTVKIDGLRVIGLRNFFDRDVWTYCQGVEPADLACTGQVVFEERLTELLQNLYKRRVSENLVFTGGCALNSTFNGKILERTGFKRLYVFSAPGDDGTAVGAALLAHRLGCGPAKAPAERTIMLPYLGSSMSERTLGYLLAMGFPGKISHHPGTVHAVAGRLLSEGKIIGWVQGKAEFGPRALGNRSILADPRRPEIKEVLNQKVKFREDFRPFAPAILDEFGPQYFENYRESPYMDRTLRFKDEVLDKIPGVVHVDHTGRLQSVRREWNPRFYDLIREFFHRTGIPVILNTSFNIMGKPMIHSVEDAIGVFFTTGLDALVIGDYLVTK